MLSAKPTSVDARQHRLTDYSSNERAEPVLGDIPPPPFRKKRKCEADYGEYLMMFEDEK